MARVACLCLIICLFAATARAEPLSRDIREKAVLSDLARAGYNPYFENPIYRYFTGAERKRLPLPARRDLLSLICSRSKAFLYTVQPNDTLKKIAHEHRTTVEFIKQINTIKSGRLRPGQKLWIVDAPLSIEINKKRNRLYLKAGGVLIKKYQVSTGKSADQTPPGVFIIRSRYPYPTWFHKGTVVSSSSPDNFLGSRWLGFDKPQYGIHGTIFPQFIGHHASRGCVRMRNEDVEELYEFVPIGTTVVITGS